MKKATDKKARRVNGVTSYHVIEKGDEFHYLTKINGDGSEACIACGEIEKTAKGYNYRWLDPFGKWQRSYLEPGRWEITE